MQVTRGAVSIPMLALVWAGVLAPCAGVDEDPVTGSTHCCLGPYWQRKLGRDAFTAWQASARGGLIKVAVRGNRVTLSGEAVTVLRGVLLA